MPRKTCINCFLISKGHYW